MLRLRIAVANDTAISVRTLKKSLREIFPQLVSCEKDEDDVVTVTVNASQEEVVAQILDSEFVVEEFL